MKEHYTIKELSIIFKLSNKSTIKYLKNLNIPIITKERFKTIITLQTIKDNNINLYNSIILTLNNRITKPFYSIRDLSKLLNKSYSNTYRYILKNKTPTTLCGNKLIVIASTLLLINNTK